eukprot:1161662-Pelagomonas_calceolata.AAC.15
MTTVRVNAGCLDERMITAGVNADCWAFPSSNTLATSGEDTAGIGKGHINRQDKTSLHRKRG